MVRRSVLEEEKREEVSSERYFKDNETLTTSGFAIYLTQFSGKP